jgi:exosortase
MSSTQRLPFWLKSLLLCVLAAVSVWAYFPTLRGLFRVWDTDPNYSQGFLVPVLALGLLWHRYRQSPPATRPEPLGGVALLLIATALRGVAAYRFVTPVDHLSLLVTITAFCLLFGGRPWLNVAWPALALLIFMFPIPASLGGSDLPGRLQEIATRSSTFALQTLGVLAVREGNVIIIKNMDLGVEAVCSGLRMLMVFCALAVVTAVLVPVGRARKIILVVSAIPLAIFCNVLRITIAGIAGESLGEKAGHFVFHDLAGWLMVPFAFVLLGAEVYALSKLFMVVPTAGAETPPLSSFGIRSEKPAEPTPRTAVPAPV